jgi:hypothetical protein
VALAGVLSSPPNEADEPSPPVPVQRWYASDSRGEWALLGAAPGHLNGTWQGLASLRVAPGPYEPSWQVEGRGGWRAQRVAVALCPWRGTARAAGAFTNEQRHAETVEFELWPTGDSGVVGEGAGRAEVSGGVPGGCEYSGGGAFAVRVVGELRDGRFRLRLEDDEHPQLLVTTTCATHRHVAPHAALTTVFDWFELPEAAGAQARLDAPRAAVPVQGVLEVTIQPASGAAPP